eukprot:6008431-Alexandrium_andersonii.AAC.1
MHLRLDRGRRRSRRGRLGVRRDAPQGAERLRLAAGHAQTLHAPGTELEGPIGACVRVVPGK